MACLFFQATVLSAVALYRSKTLSSQLTISDISHMRVHTNADGEKGHRNKHSLGAAQVLGRRKREQQKKKRNTKSMWHEVAPEAKVLLRRQESLENLQTDCKLDRERRQSPKET